MARKAKDLDLILHVGLHKTATSYVQNILSARRYDLVQHGVLYPSTGISSYEDTRTREGAQSGHMRYTWRGMRKRLVADLLEEVPPTAAKVVLSAEDFTNPRVPAEEHVELFGGFRTITVVLVLRRQDDWVESYYKQVVDQYGAFETRPFDEYLAQEGMGLLDFYTRFSPWRELIGPDNFHVVSYDDVADGKTICEKILEVAGVAVEQLEPFPGIDAPRYQSGRGIDTVGLRILNGCRVKVRKIRDKAAQEIYAASPPGDIELLTPEIRAAIQARCAPINERIEAEWFTAPVPGFRFGADVEAEPVAPPAPADFLTYVERAIVLANSASVAADAEIAEAESKPTTDDEPASSAPTWNFGTP